jgi:DNA polymerase elongation subunit (family B)
VAAAGTVSIDSDAAGRPAMPAVGGGAARWDRAARAAVPGVTVRARGADRRPIYGLDIETDTTIDGLDPRVAAVVTAALSTAEGDEVFGGTERELFTALDLRLRTLPPGVISTWNGAVFDLPFLAERAARLGLVGGLRLVVDRTIVLRRWPLPGHVGAYAATWHGHAHVDAYRLYRSDVGRVVPVSCALKAIARLVGITPVEVDRSRIHELSDEALAAYVASDARLARVLAERRHLG